MGFKTQLKWSEIKQFVDNRSVPLQFIELDEIYRLAAADGPFIVSASIKKTSPANSDQTDFETNYKSSANGKVDKSEYDSLTGRLKTDGIFTASPSSNAAVPVISKKFRVDDSDEQISLDNNSFTTIYSYSGSGKFYGAAFNFDSNYIKWKLTIDGEKIFDLSIKDIENMARFGGSSNKSGGRKLCNFFEIGTSDRVEFSPPYPFNYDTEVKFEAYGINSSNRDMDESFVFLTKET